MVHNCLITLLSDFGLRDAYVGQMKGVILSHCPEARIVDLSHDVSPQDVRGAAWLLATSWAYFPPSTIHVAVVDPGVGSTRRILVAEVKGHRFLAPDNGLLSLVFSDATPKVWSVERKEFFLPSPSRTFHGRDIFAPVAAALARSIPPADLGPPVQQWETLPIQEVREQPDGTLVGEVVWVDHFGNLITNLPGHRLPMRPIVSVASHRIHGLSPSYAEAEAGHALAILGSTGHLEIAVGGHSAAEQLGAQAGTAVRVEEEEAP